MTANEINQDRLESRIRGVVTSQVRDTKYAVTISKLYQSIQRVVLEESDNEKQFEWFLANTDSIFLVELFGSSANESERQRRYVAKNRQIPQRLLHQLANDILWIQETVLKNPCASKSTLSYLADNALSQDVRLGAEDLLFKREDEDRLLDLYEEDRN